MCSQMWSYSVEQSVNDNTLNIRLDGAYLGSQAAMACSLCAVISSAVERAVHDLPVESVFLHTRSVGGQLDMIVWLVNGGTQFFDLYTHLVE
jgi:hypothetical protein